ncbi:MAG: phosphonate C-P lyase system protein PhnH [Pseudomonadota bacterium]
MQAVPAPSPMEAHANATFDALLWALSRPGTVRGLPSPGEVPIIRALLDRECRAYAADPVLVPEILRVGAELAEVEAADHVFLGALREPGPLMAVRLGSDLYPDDGATVVLRAQIGHGARLRLSGPGIEGATDISIGGLADGFWHQRQALLRYPMGFDLFLLDGAAVIGVPRSTHVEVL